MECPPDLTPNTSELIRRVLDEPDLAPAIRSLPSLVLAKLIGHVGLEDAGPIIALASREQLQRVFDEDLWHNAKPGLPEVFDAGRFGLWLEVMLELGEDFTLRALESMESNFLVMAFSRLIWVLENEYLANHIREDEEDEGLFLEKILEANLGNEFERYWALAREESVWNAVLEILTSLDAKNSPLFESLMKRCAALTWEEVEEQGGLGEVLTQSEKLGNDVADDRDIRREREGFVAPLEAAGFLALAKKVNPDEALRTSPDDPVLSTYIRRVLRDFPSETPGPGVPLMPLLALMKESGVFPEEAKIRMLTKPTAPNRQKVFQVRLKRSLTDLFGRNQVLHGQRMHELAYLANVVVSGTTLRGKAMRPAEAAQVALIACGMGLGHLSAKGKGMKHPLETNDCLQLFRAGWALLHQPLGVLDEDKLIDMMG